MNYRIFFSLLFISTLILVACNNKNKTQEDMADMSDVNTEGQEISEEKFFDAENYTEYSFLEYVEAKDNFKTMAAALKASGLLDSLQDAEEYTLFLPTDAAFDQIPDETLTEWMMTDKRDDLKSIIKYHLFPGDLKSNDIAGGMTVTTMSGNELLFDVNESGMTINGKAKVLDADIDTEDGTIHIINAVLIPKGA